MSRRYRGETATSLRLRAVLELLLHLTLIAFVITVLMALVKAVIEYAHDVLGHLAFCVKCIITGER